MDSYKQAELIREANQKEITARLDAQRQHKADMIEGTKALAEEREERLKELEEKRNQHKEVTPISEAQELVDLRERAEREDAQKELEMLRTRFKKGDK